MARYKETEAMSGQGMFMTVNLADQLIPGTFEHALYILVDQKLDLSDFDLVYTNDRSGRLAIPPGALLKLVLYSYSRGQISSRKIEKISKTNITAKALTGDIEADHSTVANFVSGNGEKIKKVFLQVLMICDSLGLIGGKGVSDRRAAVTIASGQSVERDA